MRSILLKLPFANCIVLAKNITNKGIVRPSVIIALEYENNGIMKNKIIPTLKYLKEKKSSLRIRKFRKLI